VSVFLGLILRARVASADFRLYTEDNYELLDAVLMNFFLLPIIMFEGGWACNISLFTLQFPYIIIFAVFGTILSTVFIGQASWWLGSLGVHSMQGWQPNYAFAALISATDPVATLANFGQLKLTHTQPLLVAIVFGESIVNDAVAIVLFDLINSVGSSTPGAMAADMLILFFGSILLGVVLAAALVLPIRFAKLDGETHSDVFYIMLVPYMIYSCAEALELSGIIACLFAGMIFKLFGSQHLSDRGMHHTETFLEHIARLAEGIIFILCGCCSAFIESSYLCYCFIALLLCLVSRAIVVGFCSQVSNVLKRHRRSDESEMITWKYQLLIWLSGLRGGVGLFLAMTVSTTWCTSAEKTQIITATFFCVLVLLLMCGTLTTPCLELLGLIGDTPADGDSKEHKLPDRASSHTDFHRQVSSSSPLLDRFFQGLQSLLGKSTEEGDMQRQSTGLSDSPSH